MHAIFYRPLFSELATQYASTMQFAQLDVDKGELKPVLDSVGRIGVPTYFVYKHGQRLDQLNGANEQLLRNLVQKYGQSQQGCSVVHDITSLHELAEFKNKSATIICFTNKMYINF